MCSSWWSGRPTRTGGRWRTSTQTSEDGCPAQQGAMTQQLQCTQSFFCCCCCCISVHSVSYNHTPFLFLFTCSSSVNHCCLPCLHRWHKLHGHVYPGSGAYEESNADAAKGGLKKRSRSFRFARCTFHFSFLFSSSPLLLFSSSPLLPPLLW